MAYLTRSQMLQAYQTIKRNCTPLQCSVLVLVAPTVDALCALKILTELLKGDCLLFKVVPVSGYEDIVCANEDFIQGSSSIKSVIMLDCGATVDLAEYLSLSPRITIFLFDSHRPYSLFNVFSNSQLIIIDDGYIGENKESLKMAYNATKFLNDPLDSEDEVFEDLQDPNSSFDAENTDPNRRSPSNSNSKSFKYRCRQKYIDYFKNGSWYGSSVSRLLLDLSDVLQRTCNDHIWCSILGVTFQQIMEVSSSQEYEEQVQYLKDRALMFNNGAEVGADLDPLERVKRREEEDSATELPGTNSPLSSVTNAGYKEGSIKYTKEFRFMLTRHWTLFNSMLHSRYMATRLSVWREKGKRTLETLIVKMGLPLSQCKIDYSSMDNELKQSVGERLQRWSKEFGLDKVILPSFVRDFGYVIRVSASDAVYALMALIEAPCSKNTGKGWIDNFYFAYDALDRTRAKNLQRGINLSMKQSQIILHEATTILSHRQLRYGRRFRYVVLRHSLDREWLSSHPMSLGKLALFLVDATRSSKRASLPLLLAAYQQSTQTYLVVTTSTPIHSTSVSQPTLSKNIFGIAFRRAAQAVRARVKHDGFDSSMIEVNSDDLKIFLQTLQTIPLA